MKLLAKPRDLLRAYFAAEIIVALMVLGFLGGLFVGVGMAVAMIRAAHGGG